MALNSIELCSSALIKLGADGISSFEDGTAEARVAARLYPLVRDALLSAHPWSFATKKVELARLAAPPVTDFAYAYQLPNDFLKALSAGDDARSRGSSYQIVNRQLHSNAESVVLSYVFRPSEGDFPAYFAASAGDPPRRRVLPAADREHLSRRSLHPPGRRRAQARQAGGQPTGHAAQGRGLHPDRGAPRMTQAFLTQTDFTAGELDPRMLGRTDLQSYQSGAAKLRNVVVEVTGGVRRRPGTAYVATAAGRGRLVAMETGPDQAYLLAFSDFQVRIFRDGVLRATVATPWNEAQVAQIAWAQRGQSLLVTHPDVHPQQLTRESDTVWTIGPWQFAEIAARLRSPSNPSPASPTATSP